MFRIKTIAATIALGVALIGSAHAGSINFTFDPTGTAGAAGDITGVTTIDQAPGNVLAINGGIPNLGQTGVGTKVTDLYHANLTAMQDVDGNNLFSNNTGGKFFTFAAGFGEVVTELTATTAKFAFDPTNPINFFEMNLQTALGNNLTGTGFTSATPGALNILRGHIVAVNTNFSVTDFSGTQPLDGNGDNQYPGVNTIAGSGGGSIAFVIDYVDSLYFPDLDIGTALLMGLLNTSLIDPFNQTNPSRAFSDDPTQNGNVPNNIGPVNGVTGPNFQFQADSNSSFFIPEPASLALMGLGLVGLGGFSRRRRQA